MERSDWDDEEQYPPAPVPAHERGWRHPSEMGAHAWVQSEPPLALGRGLGMATGAVGAMLALAVLWAMLPTHAGRSAVVSVRSTLAPQPSGLLDQTTTAAIATSTTTARSTTSASTEPERSNRTTTVPATTRPPMPTYAVNQHTEVELGAVAVAVDGGNLVITTANAVAADNTVELVLPNGTVETATVLLVDQRSGLAVLSPEAADGVTGFVVAGGVKSGDTVTVYGDEPTDVSVGDGGLDASALDASTIREGTPVVNTDGKLVALCSHGQDGMVMVPLDNLDALRRALGVAIAPTVSMGLVLNDDPSGALTIGAVDPTGPGASAGLKVGDAIVAIDGQTIADLEMLAGTLALHRPGDVVTVTLHCSDGTTSEVPLTLAARKTSI